MTRPTRALRGVAAGVVALVALTGCRGAYDLPLPGGKGGSDGYRVTVTFPDVLDLVEQSAVKVDDVTVGAVDKITLDGWSAKVTLRIDKNVTLPDNVKAELRQTSLLGEKFVSLERPTDAAPVGRLGNGDVIPTADTSRTPEVEEVLGALSLLLNGGGVGQLKIIETELNKALAGNEDAIRHLNTQLDEFVGSLDAQKSEIVRAIDGIDRLSARLAAQKKDIQAALDSIPGGLKVLADQRAQLTAMLTALSNLGAVGTRVVRASKDDTVANLKALTPILAQLNKAGDDLSTSLELLLTYPFPDKSLKAIQGDYTNLHITMDMDMRSLLRNLQSSTGGSGGSGGSGGGGGTPLPTPPPLPTPSVPGVPGTGGTGGSGGGTGCGLPICIGGASYETAAGPAPAGTFQQRFDATYVTPFVDADPLAALLAGSLA